MRFGGPLPWTGHLANPANLLRFARHAEGLGYEWVTVGEHMFYPRVLRTPHPRAGAVLPVDPAADSYEMFTLFAWLAAQTTTLRFMSAVLVVPYRSPFEIAKLVAGVDTLSGGRFVLGVAAGWMEEEFEALHLDFRQRGRITDEHLEIVSAILRDEGPLDGTYHSLPDAWVEPKPVQKPLPVIVGGKPVGPVLRRAARFGQGWWPYPVDAVGIAKAMPRFLDCWAEAGRAGERPEIHVHGGIAVDPIRGVVPSTEEVLDLVGRFAEAGATHMTLAFGELVGEQSGLTVDAVLDAGTWFAETVMPELT